MVVPKTHRTAALLTVASLVAFSFFRTGGTTVAARAPQNGGLAESEQQPPATPAPRPLMGPLKQWEYKQVWVPRVTAEGGQSPRDVENVLNGLGGRGWELVSFIHVQELGRVDYLVATFKRELLH